MNVARPGPNLGGALIRIALYGLFAYMLHKFVQRLPQLPWLLLEAGCECAKEAYERAIQKVRLLDWEKLYKWAYLAYLWSDLLCRVADLFVRLLPYILPLWMALGSF